MNFFAADELVRARQELDRLGGWLFRIESGYVHTDDEGEAVDLALPLVDEDRQRAEALVRHPALQADDAEILDRAAAERILVER